MKRDSPTMQSTSSSIEDSRKVARITRTMSCNAGPFSLTLNHVESDLFKILLEFVNVNKLNTILRANGGWVRDKLLSRECSDLDIALDNMTGVEFATRFNAWLEQSGRQPHAVGVIQRNPQRSKYLEIAKMCINGMSLDLVNLRTESYANDCSVSDKIAIGTPLEDARRRDFTVNSLFYNINENCVEDFTGRGIADLQSGILVTPIDPLLTFRDDPLRVLRGARFASALGFQLDSSIIKAAKSAVIHQALEKMISRRRMGQELSKMFLKGHPKRGLQILCCDAKVGNIIFELPKDKQSTHVNWMEKGIGGIELLEPLISPESYEQPEELANCQPKSLFPLCLTNDLRKLLAFAVILAPLRQLRDSYLPMDKKSIVETLPYYVMVESLKFPKGHGEGVKSLHTGVDLWFEAIQLRKKDDPDAQLWRKTLNIREEFLPSWRVRLGLLTRHIGKMWREALALVAVVYFGHKLINGLECDIEPLKKEAEALYQELRI